MSIAGGSVPILPAHLVGGTAKKSGEGVTYSLSATGKMVQSHHGAATVSGEHFPYMPLAIVRREGGRMLRSASQETQLTESPNTLRVKGRLSCRRFQDECWSVGLC